MKHIYDKKTGVLTLADGGAYQCGCKVRNLENGLRRKDEVVRTMPGGLPYSPQTFPRGKWRITGVERRADHGFDRDVYGDVKIRTDAWQSVKVWQLDSDGDYCRETQREVNDCGYLLHESPKSKTTLGCVRLPDGKGLEIAAKMGAGDILEVV
ncbi:MAG: L,D-transpeptidase [Treponema sp.]|jgi:hypothetical protein|nr:L,D-transpeptidase [Treponema sp.]